MGKWAFWACWLCATSAVALADAESATAVADAQTANAVADAVSIEVPGAPLGPGMDDSLIYDSLGRLVGGLALIVAMIFGAQWLMRKMQTLRPQGGVRHLKIVESVAVGQRERVVLLQYHDKHVLVGVASGRVNRIHVQDMPSDDDGPRQGEVPDDKAAHSFAEKLAEAREEERP